MIFPPSALRSSVSLCFIGLCLACGQKPTQLRIDGEIPKQVYGALPIRLPNAVVLDAKGQPLEKQPELKIDSKPSDVAMVQDHQLVPIKNGRVQVRYTLPETTLSSVHEVIVSLIDRVQLDCPEDGCDLSTGQKIELVAKFFQGEEKREGVLAQWSSSNPEVVAVDDSGKIEAKAGGEATISAKVGVYEAKVTLHVVGTAPPDKISLACKKENVNVFDAAGGCVIRMGVPMEAELTASAAGSPVKVPTLEWTVRDPEIATVEQGRRTEIIGRALGTTLITGKHESSEASLEVEVVPPPCSDGSVESFRQPMGKQDSISLSCKLENAQTCFNHYVDKKKPVQAQVDKALERCCCEIREKPPVDEAAAPAGGE